MPKIFKNGILNVFELFFFFLDHIKIYVNIGIADTFLNKNFKWNVKNVFIFVVISLYSLSMGNYVKIILTL